MPKEKPGDWIKLVFKGADKAFPDEHFHCLRCGDRYVVTMPVEITMLAAMAKAYMKSHKHCLKRKA